MRKNIFTIALLFLTLSALTACQSSKSSSSADSGSAESIVTEEANNSSTDQDSSLSEDVTDNSAKEGKGNSSKDQNSKETQAAKAKDKSNTEADTSTDFEESATASKKSDGENESLVSDSSASSSPADEKDTEAKNDSYQHASDIKTENLTDAPIESPASLGTWITSMRFSAVDENYHTVYYRIKSVSFTEDDETAAKLVKNYNEEGHTVSFLKKNNRALDYCVIQYDVAFPKDFPESKDGITNVDLPFKIVNLNGEDYTITKNNKVKSFSQVYDITAPVTSGSLHANDICRSGVAVFEMQKKQEDYLISSTYYLGATKFSSYVTPFTGDDD